MRTQFKVNDWAEEGSGNTRIWTRASRQSHCSIPDKKIKGSIIIEVKSYINKKIWEQWRHNWSRKAKPGSLSAAPPPSERWTSRIGCHDHSTHFKVRGWKGEWIWLKLFVVIRVFHYGSMRSLQNCLTSCFKSCGCQRSRTKENLC